MLGVLIVTTYLSWDKKSWNVDLFTETDVDFERVLMSVESDIVEDIVLNLHWFVESVDSTCQVAKTPIDDNILLTWTYCFVYFVSRTVLPFISLNPKTSPTASSSSMWKRHKSPTDISDCRLKNWHLDVFSRKRFSCTEDLVWFCKSDNFTLTSRSLLRQLGFDSKTQSTEDPLTIFFYQSNPQRL